MNGSYEELAARLDVIGEDIADLAIASLRDALREPGAGRSADERRLNQARRAVEKAAHLLRGLDGDGDGESRGSADS